MTWRGSWGHWAPAGSMSSPQFGPKGGHSLGGSMVAVAAARNGGGGG